MHYDEHPCPVFHILNKTGYFKSQGSTRERAFSSSFFSFCALLSGRISLVNSDFLVWTAWRPHFHPPQMGERNFLKDGNSAARLSSARDWVFTQAERNDRDSCLFLSNLVGFFFVFHARGLEACFLTKRGREGGPSALSVLPFIIEGGKTLQFDNSSKPF